MGERSFILQAVTNDSHLGALEKLLSISAPSKIIISVAFLNERGISLIANRLSGISSKVIVLAGIRNGITSAQGLQNALSLGCKVYAIDTGARSIIFHPKIYLAQNSREARIMIGSANLTRGGLNGNIEASVYFNLDLSQVENKEFTTEMVTKIEKMISEYPKHAIKITNKDQIRDLLLAGRVIDETIRIPVVKSIGKTEEQSRILDEVPRIKLKTKNLPAVRVTSFAPTPRRMAVRAVTPPRMPTTVVRNAVSLVWESKPLSRRDLSIPTGENTNLTGSMLFKKGQFDNIDQRSYFRHTIFDHLTWQRNSNLRTAHIERATASFRIIIKGVDYGAFTLRISHNTRTDTAAYQQSNSMTSLHWGEARAIVAHEDMLGRSMSLYRDIDDVSFVIEID